MRDLELLTSLQKKDTFGDSLYFSPANRIFLPKCVDDNKYATYLVSSQGTLTDVFEAIVTYIHYVKGNLAHKEIVMVQLDLENAFDHNGMHMTGSIHGNNS